MATTWNFLGIALLSRGDYDEAERVWEERDYRGSARPRKVTCGSTISSITRGFSGTVRGDRRVNVAAPAGARGRYRRSSIRVARLALLSRLRSSTPEPKPDEPGHGFWRRSIYGTSLRITKDLPGVSRRPSCSRMRGSVTTNAARFYGMTRRSAKLNDIAFTLPERGAYEHGVR